MTSIPFTPLDREKRTFRHWPKIVKGQRSGRLTVLEDQQVTRQYILCRCECGTTKPIRSDGIQTGRAQSCGCLRAERLRQALAGLSREERLRRASRRHGMTGTPEHAAWSRMRSRCNNPRNNSYKNYGGRGIKVCDRWESFENFYADMGPRPSPDHSLDRKDNELGYGPANCRWATYSEQIRNRRRYICWTAEEDSLALDLSLSHAEVSARTGRTAGACQFRRWRLLNPDWYSPPPRKSKVDPATGALDHGPKGYDCGCRCGLCELGNDWRLGRRLAGAA